MFLVTDRIAFSGEALIERLGAYRESERMFLLEN